MDTPAPRRRMPPEERRRLLVEQAAEAFARDGFALTTRDLAERAGVTQALFYKYFRSKDDLVAAVLEGRFLGREGKPDPALLAEDGRPLADRLGDFYAAFATMRPESNQRLFLRAALDGLDLPTRYRGRLDDSYLRPVLAALRRDAGLPGPEARPVLPAEREIALMLHGSVVFLGIRRSVYGTALPFPQPDIVRLHVRLFLPGAIAELARLHAAAP